VAREHSLQVTKYHFEKATKGDAKGEARLMQKAARPLYTADGKQRRKRRKLLLKVELVAY
jgi:hypothetical protein